MNMPATLHLDPLNAASRADSLLANYAASQGG